MSTNPTTQRAEIETELAALGQTRHGVTQMLDRFNAEMQFCLALPGKYPEQQVEWHDLIKQAIATVNQAVSTGSNINEAVRKAEALLEPLGAVAKQYTVHCVGHGHIDMNWMWNWPETVATTNDTFSTVVRLMEEFPQFHYSQSQASVYQIMKDYLPELYAKVKQRVAEGRWEVTANHWVEGDKNLASGEILCRHILYTKRFFHQEFGLPYDAVAIDWEPDTFGHAHTIPTILNKAGIRHYYLHRAGPGPMLFWWCGKDGSRVLTFDDRLRGYNGQINAKIVEHLLAFEQATGLKDFLFVYGVGDHGGGPTRRDLQSALAMAEWPLYPNVKLSTTQAFFCIAEQRAKDIPVIDAELNYVFEGCYTAQSNIKRANRKSENALVESEMIALLAHGLAALPYPSDDLRIAWRHAMFNQFHDILPGSGVHATYEYAQGLFQEIMTRTSMIKTRSLRRIAGMVNTEVGQAVSLSAEESGQANSLSYDAHGDGQAVSLSYDAHGDGQAVSLSYDVGGGPGDIAIDGQVSRRGAGGTTSDPFVVFNPSPWQRTEPVAMRLWDRTYPDDHIIVRDDAGNTWPAQITERGNYWGHRYIGVGFSAQDIPGLGYRTYHIAHSNAPTQMPTTPGASGNRKGSIENEYLRVEVEQSSGAIVHLVDKSTGIDLVPTGARIGLLEYYLESPHPMTAWVMGQIKEARAFVEGGIIDCPANGPHLASVRVRHALNDSRFTLTISLAAGVPRVDFTLDVNWLERGTPERGVPMLRVAFPLAVTDGVATFECPNGHVQRSTDPRSLSSYTSWLGGAYWPASEAVDVTPGDVPAQKWVDLTGKHEATSQTAGAAILNDIKYGYNVEGNTVRMTLLRSSCDPDPLPELGSHIIRFAIQPHVGAWSPSDSTRAGYAFNNPFNVVGTDVHTGSLPASGGNAEILTSNVMVSGMKKAEEDDALIVRLYEMVGMATDARIRLSAALCAPDAPAVETDVMEQPLAANTAQMQEGVLSVHLLAFGLVTVKIG